MCHGKDRDRRCNLIADSMLDLRVRLRIEVCRALVENEDAADAQLEQTPSTRQELALTGTKVRTALLHFVVQTLYSADGLALVQCDKHVVVVD